MPTRKAESSPPRKLIVLIYVALCIPPLNIPTELVPDVPGRASGGNLLWAHGRRIVTFGNYPLLHRQLMNTTPVKRHDPLTPKLLIAVGPLMYTGMCLYQVAGRILSKFCLRYSTSYVNVLPSPIAQATTVRRSQDDIHPNTHCIDRGIPRHHTYCRIVTTNHYVLIGACATVLWVYST